MGVACSEGWAPEEPIEQTQSAVRYGHVVKPFDPRSTAPAEGKAVLMMASHCSGTLVTSEYVLSAGHCTFSSGDTVESPRPSGNVTRTIDAVYNHPSFDATMVHLSQAFTDIPTKPLTTETSQGLINKLVRGWGYGVTCITDSDCTAGKTCSKEGFCTGEVGGTLRYGDSLKVFEFNYPYFRTSCQSGDHLMLPSDSGGPAFLNGAQAGILATYDDAGKPGINAFISIPEIRRWVIATYRKVAWRDFNWTDFDGDGKSDHAIWRPSEGKWYVVASKTGSPMATVHWGTQGDIPVAGDYDGDHKTDYAVFRPSNGTWYITYASGGSTNMAWGTQGDIPAPGDYDNDAKGDYAVFRPSNGTWYITYAGGGSTSRAWGTQGDIPVPGDYDGDGKTDYAVFRPSNGTWYIVYSTNGSSTTKNWGVQGDVPVAGDYDGDGKADYAVWRPSNGTWYIVYSSSGSWTYKNWGVQSDIPVAGDYDGDGKADYVIWRPSEGKWYVIVSSTGTELPTKEWGTSGDIPIVKGSVGN